MTKQIIENTIHQMFMFQNMRKRELPESFESKAEKKKSRKKIEQLIKLSRKTIGAQSGDCTICLEKYSYRSYKVTCPYACQNGEACVNCHYKYLLDSVNSPHCMHCRKEWSTHFVRQSFTEKMQKELKKRQQLLLVNRNKALLPIAQVIVERDQQICKLNEQIGRINQELARIQLEREDLVRLQNESMRIKKDDHKAVNTTKCPTNECRGFLNKGRCVICHKRTCMKCMQEVKSDEGDDHEGDQHEAKQRHVCKKDDLDTMELIRSSSKACPNCGFCTTKSEGCPQMFCISCHKAWNWNTGLIEHGTIHNPHYFEWQMATRGRIERNPLDIPCGGLPHVTPNDFRANATALNNMLRTIAHVRARSQTAPQEKYSIDLCILYLQNKISEDRLGGTLMSRHKTMKIYEEFFNIHQMFTQAGTDILQRLFRDNVNEADKYIQEMDNLRKYYNRQLLNAIQRNRGISCEKYCEFISSNWLPSKKYDEKVIKEILQGESGESKI